VCFCLWSNENILKASTASKAPIFFNFLQKESLLEFEKNQVQNQVQKKAIWGGFFNNKDDYNQSKTKTKKNNQKWHS